MGFVNEFEEKISVVPKALQMRRQVLVILMLAACLSGGSLYAQKPVEQKPTASGSAVQAPSHEIKSEVKREELSKKLMERKNELRSRTYIGKDKARAACQKFTSATCGSSARSNYPAIATDLELCS